MMGPNNNYNNVVEFNIRLKSKFYYKNSLCEFFPSDPTHY